MAVIYMPKWDKYGFEAIGNVLTQLALAKVTGNIQMQQQEQADRQRDARIIQNQQFELQRSGYKPAGTGDTPDITVGNQGFMKPQPQFSPVSVEGQTIPGQYVFQNGNSASLVSFPKEYSDFQTRNIPVGENETATIGFPVSSTGVPAYEHLRVLSTPKTVSPSDVWKGLQIKGLMGLSAEQQRNALLPGLRDSQTPLRQIDIYAKSAGVDPASLRNGSLTQDDATRIVNKVVEVGDKSILGQLMKGAFAGMPSPSMPNENRELQLLRKKATGTLTPAEETELRALRGGK